MKGLVLAALLLPAPVTGTTVYSGSAVPEYLPVPMTTPYSPPIVNVPHELFHSSLKMVNDEEERLRRHASLGILEGILAGAGSAAFLGGYIGHDLGIWRYLTGGVLGVWAALCIPEWMERDGQRERVARLGRSLKLAWDNQNIGAGLPVQEGVRLRDELAWARGELPESSIATSRKESLTYYAIVGICSGLSIYGFMKGGEDGKMIGMISLAGALGGGWMGIKNDMDIRANRRAFDAALAGWEAAFRAIEVEQR